MAEYLILKGDQSGNKRDFGSMGIEDMKRRNLHLIDDYESWKKLDEIGKAVYLANAQKECGIEVSEGDKKKALASAVAKIQKAEEVEEIQSDEDPVYVEESEIESLKKQYEEKFEKSVPARYKTDVEWIKSKL